MTKLKSIFIKGFKEKNRDVMLNFSDEPVTVIYGENGSGKTTLLKVIHAIFNKNEEYLIQENISEIELVYFNDKKEEKKIHIKLNGKVNWGENIKDLTKKTSILFGVNRGVIEDTFDSNHNPSIFQDISTIKDTKEALKWFGKATKLTDYKSQVAINDNWDKVNHISVDTISINEIENAIIKQFRAGLTCYF
jgi:ABC-type cobalamin/Fe3+-siderophores transport system ATPase subunit